MISAANKIPPMLAPKLVKGAVQDDENDEKIQSYSAQMDLDEMKPKQIEVDPKETPKKVDLSETADWDLAEQWDIHNLVCENACIFSQNDLDLGKTTLVKHSIKLADSTPFKDLDLKSGYWKVEIEEDCKVLTAFTLGPLRFYECNRMPFRLTNTPTTFQCLMHSCLGNLHWKNCIIYLDDIIIYSKTLKEHYIDSELYLRNSRKLVLSSNL